MLPYHEHSKELSIEDIASCHTRRLRRLHVEKMDPSMLIAFLIQNEQDWAKWKEEVSTGSGKSLFHIMDNEPVAVASSSELSIVNVETFDDGFHEADEEFVSLSP